MKLEVIRANPAGNITLFVKTPVEKAIRGSLAEKLLAIEEFAAEHPKGIYVLGFGNHVATIIDGIIYDSWDSSKEIPQYYWHKEGN